MGGGTGMMAWWPGVLLATMAILYAAVVHILPPDCVEGDNPLCPAARSRSRPLTGQVQVLGTMLEQVCDGRRIDSGLLPNLLPSDDGTTPEASLLPVSMVERLPELDLHTIIAHEFAHMPKRLHEEPAVSIISLRGLSSAALGYSRAHHGKSRNRLRPDGSCNDWTK